MTAFLALIPTKLESQHLPNGFSDALTQRGGTLAISHMGLIPAAARCAKLLVHHSPKRVILFGIAGGLSDAVKVGAAYYFNEVACYGIGLGSGDTFQLPTEAGWDFCGVNELAPFAVQSPRELDSPSRLLVSSCASSASPEEANWRTQKFPSAAAEDMEAFAIASVCREFSIPLTIVRGISNIAGSRQLSEWKVAEAMHAACRLLLTGV